jgi:hypothetical protein
VTNREVGVLPLGFKLRVLHDAGTLPAEDDSNLLVRCRGFAVHDCNGRVGTVCDVTFGDPPASNVLAVRTGLFFRKVIFIPTTQIDEILAGSRRIVLVSQVERSQVRQPWRPLGRVGIGGAA